MRKILELRCCTACPMRFQASYASCLKIGREIKESDKFLPFPAWCPLPEKEKEESDAKD